MKGARRLTVEEYVRGVLAHDRFTLSRAITLVESDRADDRNLAITVLESLLPYSGGSTRIGITGVPGVGKSTFIEAFGKHLTSAGKKVAVLAVDPSSQKTGGSILGDKTRMEELSKNANAYIRPTSAGTTVGGVARHSRESILLCEAAGYDIVLVETVGVGQSETMVRNMTDFFLLLGLPGAGDELQGIKKGIMEMADGIVITKADGENAGRAQQAQRDYQYALHLFPESESGFAPRVLLSSAVNGTGIAETWKMIEDFCSTTSANGFFAKQREQQNLRWFYDEIQQLMFERLRNSQRQQHAIEKLESKIKSLEITPSRAAQLVVNRLYQ